MIVRETRCQTIRDKRKIAVGGALTAAGLLAYAVYKSQQKHRSDDSTDSSNADTSLIKLGIEPATPLAALAFLESFSPSLMTRSSTHQGAATAMAVLAARGISRVIETETTTLVGAKDISWQNRVAVRAGLAGAGHAISQIPVHTNESKVMSFIRTAGRLTAIASLGGIIFDVNKQIERKLSNGKRARPYILGGLLSVALVYRAGSLLKERRQFISTVPEDPVNKLAPAVLAGIGVVAAGRTTGHAMRKTQQSLEGWLGDGPLKPTIARGINIALWSSLFVGLYAAGLRRIGQANEKVEPAYSKQPNSPLVSGSPSSLISYRELGLQGRRFVHDALLPREINEIMGGTSAKSPVRVYVGYNSSPRYQLERVERALAELNRTKAFERKYLLLVSPTGTGWVDQTMIESAEVLSKGDIATCVVQYSKYPSFLSLQQVWLGSRQFRSLLWGVHLQIQKLPASKRPKVLVFGESLGAWSSSDTVMQSGIAGFDHYGIDRALWIGMPKFAKWSRVKRDLNGESVPPGAMRILDNPSQIEALSDEDRAKLRAVLLNHDNDPITHLNAELLYRRPQWLRNGHHGRGVPKTMEWRPVVTFFQTAIDAANAMRVIPGKFRSHGHDYRKDMARFVNLAFNFKATESQLKNLEPALQHYELLREARLKAATRKQRTTLK